MKTRDEIQKIIDRIEFMDREFRLLDKGDGFLLQVTYVEADIDTGVPEEQRARKWYISPHMTETEIVETAFAACQRSMMHVVGEHFLYLGKRVYSPHFEIDARLELCIHERYDARPKEDAR